MSKKTDIFVYFDVQDNQPDEHNKTGWITNFNKFLTSMVGQIARFEPQVQMSKEGSIPKPEDLKDTVAFVFVASPASIGSGNLARVLENFKSAALNTDPSKSKITASRIFKVLKAPIPQAEQPEIIRAYVGYELYDFDITTGAAQEIKDFFSRNAEQSYWLKLVDLAYDISEVLMSFQEVEIKQGGTETKKIYLAETGPELHTQRNIIKRELQRSGFEVLPRESLPANNAKDFIADNLKNSDLSVHLLGDKILRQNGEDVGEIQNEIASEYLKEKGKDLDFSRLIWISPYFSITSDEQQSYLEKLRRDVEETGNTEIFQTPFEDFKSIVRRILTESSVSEFMEVEESKDKRPKIYIVYEKSDEASLINLSNHLESKGFEVLKPSFSGSLIDIRQQHINHLVNFDGVIVLFGSVNEFWVKMKLLDILKSPGFGRLKSLKNMAVMARAGKKFDTKAFSNYNVTLIENDDPSSSELDQFISKIKES